MPLKPEYLRGTDTQKVSRNLGPAVPNPAITPQLHYRNWVAPATASLNAFVLASLAGNTLTQTYVRTGPAPFKTNIGTLISGTPFGGALAAGVMDAPRNVVITVTAAAVVALSGTIFGTDEYGRTISEAWSVIAGGVTQTFTGKKAFWTVDGVTVTSVADATGDTVTVGTGNVLGLPTRNAVGGVAAAVKETTDGAPVVTGTLVAASAAAAADAQGTYLPATVPNGAHNYEVWYLENDPQI